MTCSVKLHTLSIVHEVPLESILICSLSSIAELEEYVDEQANTSLDSNS